MIERMKKICFTLISLSILVLVSVPAFSQPKLGYVKVDEVIRKANIANIEKELQRKRRQAREDLTQRKNEELAAVVEKARAAIKEIAEDEKYDLILENSVYASPKVDITAKVIKALNEKK